jgi:hypothetical protein
MRRIGMVLAAVLLVAGCARTSTQLNEISLGMTKQEVLSKLGRPDSVAGQADQEYLVYHMAADSSEAALAAKGALPRYYVRLKGESIVTAASVISTRHRILPLT